MKGMMPRTMPKPKGMMAMLVRHEHMIRRATNHNVHIITHHGKIMVGRKGRTT